MDGELHQVEGQEDGHDHGDHLGHGHVRVEGGDHHVAQDGCDHAQNGAGDDSDDRSLTAVHPAVDQGCRHAQGQGHDHRDQSAEGVGEQVRDESQYGDDGGSRRAEGEAAYQDDDARWVVFEPGSGRKDREGEEAQNHGQGYEERVDRDPLGRPAS